MKILKQTLRQKAVKLKEDTKKKTVYKDRTRKLIGIIPDENREWNLATGIYKASSKSAYICPAQPSWTSTVWYTTVIGSSSIDVTQS